MNILQINKNFYSSLYFGMVLNLEYLKDNKDALLTGVFTDPEEQVDEIDWYCGIDGESENTMATLGFDISYILTEGEKSRTYNSIDFLVRNVPSPSIYLDANSNDPDAYPFEQEFLDILISRSGPILETTPNIFKNDVPAATAVEDDVLEATNGTYANTVDSFTYQWTKGGVDISGATENTYTVLLADVGGILRCEVTATNAGGSTTSVSRGILVS